MEVSEPGTESSLAHSEGAQPFWQLELGQEYTNLTSFPPPIVYVVQHRYM